MLAAHVDDWCLPAFLDLWAPAKWGRTLGCQPEPGTPGTSPVEAVLACSLPWGCASGMGVRGCSPTACVGAVT